MNYINNSSFLKQNVSTTCWKEQGVLRGGGRWHQGQMVNIVPQQLIYFYFLPRGLKSHEVRAGFFPLPLITPIQARLVKAVLLAAFLRLKFAILLLIFLSTHNRKLCPYSWG